MMNWEADIAGFHLLQDQNGMLQIADDVSNILHFAIEIMEVFSLTSSFSIPLDYNKTINSATHSFSIIKIIVL